jgi:putative aminopeptidase FrvX
LTPEEAMGTRLELGQTKSVPNQAFILDIGPAVEEDKYGIKIGDRVLLQGTFVPVPKFRKGRELAIVDPHAIKCVLDESFDEE